MDASVQAAPPRRVLVAIGAIAFATLLLEITLTRLFSAMMFYHFTFLAISLALFGIGASGVYVYLRSRRFTRQRLIGDLSRYSQLFALTAVAALVYVLRNPVVVVTGTSKVPSLTTRTLLELLVFNMVVALPFFFGGVVISLAITHYRKHINRVYAYDLCAAALACLFAAPFLIWFGGPTTVLLVALLAVVASVLFSTPQKKHTWIPLALAIALVIVNMSASVLRVPSVKGVRESRTLFEAWNSFSRVTVERMPNGQHDIKIDASAATRLMRQSDIGKSRWRQEISALAYHLHGRPAAKALIIGPGGGKDVVHALESGIGKVVGVEVNSIIARTIMRQEFRELTGDLYGDERVTIVTDEGRSFIRRSRERYDVIQATLVDTWAATASGAFALTENTLYTAEAFADYLSHLTDDGVVTFSRWHWGNSPESARLIVLVSSALEQRGVPVGSVRQHLFFAVKGGLGTLLAKRTPFTSEELDILDQAAYAAGFNTLLSPRTPGSARLERLVDEGSGSALVGQQRDDLSPPTDDRPFFFFFIKSGDLFSAAHLRQNFDNPALWILMAFGSAIGALAVIFIVLPLLIGRWSDLRSQSWEDRARHALGLFYFALIGLAFIVVEIALLQKFSLFLGHPSYALIVVLFAILLGTGTGAWLAGLVQEKRHALLIIGAGLALSALVCVYSQALGPLLNRWVPWSLWARITLAGALALVCGVLMGTMLPMGVRIMSQRDQRLIPWAWGVNGATSVIGTVAATVLAIGIGYSFTMLIGGLSYALCTGVAVVWRRTSRA